MAERETLLAARGLTDEQDRLLTVDGPLADLQESCGGMIPGTLAVPELLNLVQQAREMGLRIAREFSAFDGLETVSGFARIRPLDEAEGGGCEVVIENWQRIPAKPTSTREMAERLDAIDRAAAEVTARLDASQRVQLLIGEGGDTGELQALVRDEPGKPWSDYVSLRGVAHRQPLHWRLLDGVECEIPGSERIWRVRLLPLGGDTGEPRGFEMLLVADSPLEMSETEADSTADHSRLIGSALTPVLRQPIARVIANAETIRAKLAGPLRTEYSDYAGNIAAAGQHLAGMLDDLADLEVVEAPGFSTAKDKVDLVDVARRAAGILGVRAQDRSIKLDIPDEGGHALASAEFRRVLQILINLIGNAIAYSPEGSAVTIATGKSGSGMVQISVTDEGPGVSEEQAAKIFDKFERLGRDGDDGNDTGSGLGLYISRKLALAMDGDLTLESPADGTKALGARFTLSLPAFE
ncbi:HAMP domain-containing sensor histidine kinase [Erythrobacter sp. THAF29]|uniref:sensor histidine kinase n=1 Tax=Erythrobacter sp. THAF29 TaxID=2587851 RepID=UPI00126975AF|nr:HAMP domain-containing sensor histidine kinase [Erythrobacter sp. THAF29]QFT77976.1 Non-motile and phage-resistance protein [Erythrobacter sp. THAF29]